MQSLNTFITKSKPIPEAKKSALINNLENIIVYWQDSELSEV